MALFMTTSSQPVEFFFIHPPSIENIITKNKNYNSMQVKAADAYST